IVAAIDAPFVFEDQNIHIGISIGVAICPGDSDEPSTLLRQADIAMYVAKRSNTDIAFYKPELDEHSIKRLSMAGELRRGLKQKQLVVHYQPNVDLQQNKVIGVEALVRWQHPEKGLIPPDEFIPLAEHSGHIRELTAFVLEESLQQLHLWNSTGLTLLMSINMSGRSLHDSDLCQHIAQLLEQWQINPEHLQLEITERALMYDPIQANQTLSQLHAMGIKLSIDDFGTGYSSLAYLKQLPINEIKVDKSFVSAMLEQNADKIIVRSTIDLAHNMGHQVIAEGVDNAEVLELLREMDCDLAQGYYISHPLAAEELRKWLYNSDWWPNS
ncbi:MAG TPA: GGDEF domain-containing protein, partial [Candidatus Tenderia electrophaga]|nr:GGDEF domain-containing protein [Candidatus Tenderia electrophaga]